MQYFGDIVDGKMILSETGEIAHSMWYEIPKHSPVAQLGAFVVMPDHVHGILIINNPKYLIEWGIEEDDLNVNHNRKKNADGENADGRNADGRNADGRNADGQNADGQNADGQNAGGGHTLHLHFHHQRNQFTIGECIGKNRYQNIGKNTVSSIIGSYKSAVTKHANRQGLENGWQPLFYERIIKNYTAYNIITQYIINNPKKWKG